MFLHQNQKFQWDDTTDTTAVDGKDGGIHRWGEDVNHQRHPVEAVNTAFYGKPVVHGQAGLPKYLGTMIADCVTASQRVLRCATEAVKTNTSRFYSA